MEKISQNKWAEILGWVKLSEDDLKLAQLAFNDGFSRGAISRAYYAMFYVAKAYMLAFVNDTNFKTHAGALAAFHKIAKENQLEKDLAQNLSSAFELRGEADYDLNENIGQKEAKQAIEWAQEFVERISQELHRLK